MRTWRVLAVATLMLLTPLANSVAAEARTSRGIPGFVEFHSVLGDKTRADCVFEWVPNSDAPPEIRCDRYKTINGTRTQQISLRVDLGKGQRFTPGDAENDPAGVLLKRGDSIQRIKMLHCKALLHRMRCWNSHTGHGFVMKRRGYRVF